MSANTPVASRNHPDLFLYLGPNAYGRNCWWIAPAGEKLGGEATT